MAAACRTEAGHAFLFDIVTSLLVGRHYFLCDIPPATRNVIVQPRHTTHTMEDVIGGEPLIVLDSLLIRCERISPSYGGILALEPDL